MVCVWSWRVDDLVSTCVCINKFGSPVRVAVPILEMSIKFVVWGEGYITIETWNMGFYMCCIDTRARSIICITPTIHVVVKRCSIIGVRGQFPIGVIWHGVVSILNWHRLFWLAQTVLTILVWNIRWSSWWQQQCCIRGFTTLSLIGCGPLSRVLIPWLLTLLCCVLCPGLVCDHQLLLLLIAVLLVPLALVLIVVQTFLPLRLPRAVGPAVVPVPVLVILIP